MQCVCCCSLPHKPVVEPAEIHAVLNEFVPVGLHGFLRHGQRLADGHHAVLVQHLPALLQQELLIQVHLHATFQHHSSMVCCSCTQTSLAAM